MTFKELYLLYLPKPGIHVNLTWRKLRRLAIPELFRDDLLCCEEADLTVW